LVRRSPLVAFAVAAVLIAVIAALLMVRPRDASPPTLRIQPLTSTGDVRFPSISPDGHFVAYVRHGAIWVRQLPFDDRVRVVPLAPETAVKAVAEQIGRDYRSLTITPDGKAIDFVVLEGTRSDLWRVPLLGGAPNQIGTNVWSAVGWSPDRSHMAFIRRYEHGRTALIVADAEGTRERTVLTKAPPAYLANNNAGGAPSSRPSWSVDGKSIAVVVFALSAERLDSPYEISVVEVATGVETRTMVRQDTMLRTVAWLSPTRLLIEAGNHVEPSGNTTLWSVDRNVHEWIPITREFATFQDADLTADRQTAVATRSEKRTGVWVGDSTGQHLALRIPESAAGASDPVVDDEGGVLYSAMTGDGYVGLYRLDSGQSEPSLIASRIPGFFSATPDGRTVVFTGPSPFPLYRANKDGTNIVKLVEKNAFGLTVTPDAKTVLFSPAEPGLFTVPLQGGAVRKISNRLVTVTQRVSPDGKRVAFQTDTQGVGILCELPACSNSREIPLPPGDATWRWAPDGRGFAYINEADGRNLWEHPVDGGRDRPLTKLDDARIIDFAWSSSGKLLVLSRGQWRNDAILLGGLR
jgi:Tol biopolymer transport system component